MADNFGGGENIFYTDDANIVLIDPNSIVDRSGKKQNRIIKQENLVMYANLEVQSVPRTKLAVGQSVDSGISNFTIASINFLKPQGKNAFDTSYTEQLTGGRNAQGRINQLSFDNNSNPQQQNYVDTQLLGISSISVDILSNGIPSVNMQLIDIQGRALFETGGNSPYSVFLYYPYPLFRLTLKGFYGKAIQYELMLKSFNASFDQSKGNYNIDLQFIARTSAILDDVRLGYLFALPNMYPIYKTQENAAPNTSQEATASLNQVGTDVAQQSRIELTSKGYSKLVQVFDEYKKKNLIDKQVPTLTLDAMSKKLEKYTQFLNEQYQQLDFTNVIALERYTESIDRYFRDIRKWRGQFISETDVIALEDSTRMYGLKDIKPVTNSQDTTSQANNLNISITANTELTGYTQTNKKEIQSVPVWGKKIATPNDFFEAKQFQRKFTSDDINFIETYFLRTGKTVVNTKTDQEFKDFQEQIKKELLQKGTLPSEENSSESSPTSESPYYYTFDKFEKATLDLGEVITQRNQEENERLNELFQSKLKINGTGSDLTFRPTIRNIVGVIMASVDAFYRLMDDVHEQAWNQRNNRNRINSIIKANSPSQDGKSSVQTASNNITDVIYPWPQFVQKKEVVGNTEYQISYPGSKSVVGFTKGYDVTVWPEVNFVEQFLYGLTIKEVQYNSTAQNTTKLTINYTPSSVIEFKFKDDIYVNTEVYTFIYEMYERLLLNTFYSGLYYQGVGKPFTNEDIMTPASDMELSNIVNSKISNGLIIDVLKNKIGNTSLYDYLKTTSGNNQEGELWGKFIEQLFNTGYINEDIVKSTEIYSENTYGKNGRIPIKIESFDNISKYIGSYQSTDVTLFDTYPFVITDFQKKLEPPNNSNNFYNTVNTYVLDPGNLFITNEKNEIRPYTKPSSSLSGFTGNVSYASVNDFFAFRYSDGTKRLLTEGILTNTNTKINGTTTTSMLNTPYFLNSLLQEGTGDTFYRSSYLFLNSLPLSTLYEKYLDTKNRNKDEHIFPSLTKFSAAHKLPYAWILKLGSVWYRYKKYVNDGIDILDDVWKDFDYQSAYDPTTKNVSKVYNIGRDGSSSKLPYSITSSGSETINTGFYPGLYNSVYKILTGVDLFPNNNVDIKPETFWIKNLRVTTNEDIIVNSKPNGPITPVHSYFNITNDYSSVFGSEYVNKILLFPSAGYLPFQQSYYSVSSNFQNVTKEQVNTPNMFNGSARPFWVAPNYGWFESNTLKKPNYDEYLKYVYTARTFNQAEFHFFSESAEPNQSYAKIEDLFGVFDKQQLDLFENEFITFSQKGSISSLFTESDTPETKYTNFQEILKRLLIVDRVATDSLSLANAQSTAVSNVLSKFLEISVYLKIGNAKKFDRIQFGNFIETNDELVKRMQPKTPQNYGKYVQGTLPSTTGVTVTLEQSQTNNPDEWKALKLNVGFSTIEGIQYTNQSYIYDFFIDNDIAFTVNNIEKLSKLIQIYATQKYVKGNKYNSKQYKQDITDLIKNTYTRRTQIEDRLRSKLPNALNQGPTEGEVAITRFEGDSTKLEMWELFKALNDKWVAGIDFNRRVLFEEFLFFDKSNRDIGDDFIVNVESIRKYCSWSNSNTSVMSLLKQLFAENRMNFFVMPAYINFYGKPYLNSSTRNQTILNNANDVFSTFGYVDYIDSSPKFLCQYIGKPSETLSMENDPKYPFKSDSFDMGVSAGNSLKNTRQVSDQFRNNKAVGFVVDFGAQNQSVFKSIEIAQNQNVTSSEQIQTVVDLGQLGGNKKTTQQTVSLFELYKNRTYDCTLKTLGNVMIQPTMYFVLRHMPMFNGTYIIRNVKHEIGPGQFNTTIKGQRMSSLSVPKVYDELAAVNEDFTKKLQNTIKTEVANNNVVTFNSNSREYLQGQAAVTYKIDQRIPYQGRIFQSQDVQAQPDPNNLWGLSDNRPQSKLERMNFSTRNILLKNLIIDLQSVEDKNMRLFLFTLFFLSGYDTEQQSFLIKLNNLFGITGDVEWSESLLPNVSGYRSLDRNGTVIPFFGFKTIKSCLNFAKQYFELILKSNLIDSPPECTKKDGYKTTDLNVENESYKCTADIFVKIFYETWYFGPQNQKKYKDDTNYQNFLTIAERALVIAGTNTLI